jgi:hypothetical protein
MFWRAFLDTIVEMAFWITTLALASMSLAIAQDVPPPSPMRGEGASLKDTMKFIQDKLPGKVNDVVYQHNNITGTDGPSIKESYELSNASADASRCSISFHTRFDSNGRNITDKDDELFLKQVREAVPMQIETIYQQGRARAGQPEVNIKIDPPIFGVVLKSESKVLKTLRFYEDTLADRVSKALQHAVNLCGGGNQEPF